MPRSLPLLLVLASLLAAPGCFLGRERVNQPIPRSSIDTLQPGATTASQAVELLGAPAEVVQLGYRSAYRYEFSTSKRAVLTLLVVNFSNTDARSDRIWLFFDAEDVLTHVGSTYAAADASYSMPWERD